MDPAVADESAAAGKTAFVGVKRILAESGRYDSRIEVYKVSVGTGAGRSGSNNVHTVRVVARGAGSSLCKVAAMAAACRSLSQGLLFEADIVKNVCPVVAPVTKCISGVTFRIIICRLITLPKDRCERGAVRAL